MKKSKYITAALLSLALFGGCSSNSVSCDDDAVLKLVKENTYEYAKNATLLNMVYQLQMSKNIEEGKSVDTSSMMSNMYVDPNSAIGLGMLMMKDNEDLPFKAMFVIAEILLKDAKYLIEDIRTVKKDGSLNQVECKGVVKYFKEDNSEVGFNFDLDYTAQSSDGKVFVEIIDIAVQ